MGDTRHGNTVGIEEQPSALAWERHAVERAAAGDAQAYAALVRHHQARLFSFLGRMGLRQAEAEDLAQDAFLRAWLQLPRYRAERASFTTWLYTIARRLALNHLDRAETRCRAEWPDEDDGPACAAPGPAGRLEGLQEQQRLQAAWRRLSTADRSILALAYVQGLDLEDVARIEHCSPGTARVRVHRARERLRAVLDAPLPRPLPLGADR